jgi:hypothetical protein
MLPFVLYSALCGILIVSHDYKRAICGNIPDHAYDIYLVNVYMRNHKLANNCVDEALLA